MSVERLDFRAHYKERHDPPGMWSGYNATRVNPIATNFLPRMGVRIRGVSMMECHCDGGPFATAEEAQAIGRAAAWAWYERRLELAARLASNVCGFDDWHHWPRCLAWSDADCDAVERWLAEGGEVPEALRHDGRADVVASRGRLFPGARGDTMEPWSLSNATVTTKIGETFAGAVVIRHNAAGDPVVAQVNVGGSWVTIPWDEVVKIDHA